MGEEKQGPPALPGEVWRGVVGKYLCAVADPSTEPMEEPGGEGLWCRVPDIWGRAHLDKWEPAEAWQWLDVLRAWALAERDRAEKAEKIAAAERALRVAIEAGYEGPCEHAHDREPDCDDCARDAAVNAAGDALRALGVEP